MSNEVSTYGGQLPANAMPRAATPTSPVWTRQGRAIARQDNTTELQAREDYNQARLAVHRTHLNTIVEKARNQARAELMEDVLLHASAVDSLITTLSSGKPGLELNLRDIQSAYQTGEMQRILRRGIGI